jgi:serine/threonine-protein kinase
MPESLAAEYVALQAALAGRYSLDRELGRGGMGIVYLARDVALDRPVAIKLLPPDMAKDGELKQRFLREARIAAQLSHPNIVPIHLVEERDDLVYFVMAFVDGESLSERVRRAGPLRPGEASRLIQEVAWALAYAHVRGVVHRDIKPDNILLERAGGRAMVSDFGIARSTAAPALTAHGLILGTLQYMAPEQASADGPVDGRADLYALGVTAFFALTGRLPFEAATAPALIAAHLLEPAPPLATVAPHVPARLAAAVDKCLAKDPAARWPSGEALAAAVADVPQAAAVPPSVHAFGTALSGAGGQLSLLVLIALWADMLLPGEHAAILKLLAVAAIMPVIQVWAAARAVAIAGFTSQDVAEMLSAEATRSDRFTEYTMEQQHKVVRQLSSPLGRFVVGGLGGFLVFSAAVGAAEMIGEGGAKLLVLPIIAGVAWMGAEMANHGIGVGPWKDRLKRYLEGAPSRQRRLIRWVWGTAPIRWLLALGRLGQPKPAANQASPTAQQPTEVLLAKAAGDLFDALPRADRAALAAVPDAVKRLEAAAAKLRDRRDALGRAIAEVGEADGSNRRAKVAADLTAERGGVERRLAAAVEALENLRLDLLKLRAGMGSTGDLTEAIEAAKRVGEDVEFVLAGRREAAAVAGPPRS